MSVDNFVCVLEEYQEQKKAVQAVEDDAPFPSPELERLWKIERELHKALKNAIKDCLNLND